MMNFFEMWMGRWRKRNAHAIGYRFGNVPTADEVAARAMQNRAEPTLMVHQAGSADAVRKLLELVEECGEVQHAALKVLEHGWEDRTRGGKGMSRRAMLERELGHVSAAAANLYSESPLRLSQVKFWERGRLWPRSTSPAKVQGSGEIPTGQ